MFFSRATNTTASRAYAVGVHGRHGDEAGVDVLGFKTGVLNSSYGDGVWVSTGAAEVDAVGLRPGVLDNNRRVALVLAWVDTAILGKGVPGGSRVAWASVTVLRAAFTAACWAAAV